MGIVIIGLAVLPAACASFDNAMEETGKWFGWREPAPATAPPAIDSVYCFRSLGIVDCHDSATPYGVGIKAQPASRAIGNPPPAEPAPREKSG